MTGQQSRPAPRKTALRWAVAAAVLLAAVGIALWPLAHVPWAPGQPGQETGGPPAADGAGPADQATPADPAALAGQAALAPCPAAPATPAPVTPAVAVAAPAGPLAGVTVPCLVDGAPVPLGAALAGRETLVNVWSHTCQDRKSTRLNSSH